MTALTAEWIKLTSLRTTWLGLAVAAAIAFALAGGFTAAATTGAPVTVTTTQAGHGTAMMAVVVLAATSVTSEYRFGTIQLGFLAAPGRTRLLLAKAAMAAAAAAAIGEITAFASLALVAVLEPGAALGLTGEPAWRAVAGTGPVYAVAAVIAVAVGALLRNSAVAVGVLLLEPIVLERLVTLIPGIGPQALPWMPFAALENVLAQGNPGLDDALPAPAPYPPWLGLGHAAVIALLLLLVAVITTRRRDA